MRMHTGAPFPECQHLRAGSITEIQRQSNPLCRRRYVQMLYWKVCSRGIVVYVVSKMCKERVEAVKSEGRRAWRFRHVFLEIPGVERMRNALSVWYQWCAEWYDLQEANVSYLCSGSCTPIQPPRRFH